MTEKRQELPGYRLSIVSNTYHLEPLLHQTLPLCWHNLVCMTIRYNPLSSLQFLDQSEMIKFEVSTNTINNNTKYREMTLQ